MRTLAGLALTLIPTLAQAVTLHVDENARCRPPGQGTVACPFHTIASATEIAQALDTVLVKPGTYGVFDVGPGVFVGGEPGTVVDLAGASAFIQVENGGSLHGLTVRGGQGETAVWVRASATISHCIFEDNTTVLGAVYADSGFWDTLTVNNTLFRGNTGSHGAALRSSLTPMEIFECTFEENRATEQGGAIFSSWADLHLFDSSFTNNEAKQGGALFKSRGVFQVVGSTFTNNVATESGGAIGSLYSISAKLNANIFTHNRAANEGGALDVIGWSSIQPFEINSSRFINNLAIRGGAIHAQAHPIHLSRSILDDNRALHGSGLYLAQASHVDAVTQLSDSLIVRGGTGGLGCAIFATDDTTALALNTTFAANTGLGSWGRAACVANSYMLAINSILWDEANEITVSSGGVFDALHSDIYQSSGVYPGNGNLNVAPQLDAAYAPASGSPVLDQGTNFVVSSSIDLNGDPRIVDGDGDNIPVVDLGAVEHQAF